MDGSSSGIPTNLITGFLGVGKTTALLNVLASRPKGSRWAVLVNEYGEVGIDGAFLENAENPISEGNSDSGIVIREVAGGCICCTSTVYFRFALAQILSHVRPERILIETTGVGHPAKLFDMLRHPVYAGRIDLRSTIGIIDPSDFINPKMRDSQVFRDQIQLADVLILNKRDRITPEIERMFLEFAQAIFPPKLEITITEQGKILPEWLDRSQHPAKPPFASESPINEDMGLLMDNPFPEAKPVPLEPRFPEPGKPIRRESHKGDHFACGWIFAPSDQFSKVPLLALCSTYPKIYRLKGVFHTQSDWLVINRVREEMTTSSTFYRHDNRIEIFAEDADCWDDFELRLIDCLIRE